MSQPVRDPDQVTTWKSYTADLDHVCTVLNIPVPRGAEIEADLSNNGSLRITVKAQERNQEPF